MTANETVPDRDPGERTAPAERRERERREETPAPLSVRNLSKTFGSGEEAVEAVSDVTFDVERGSVVGLLGPNGAGKTTTIKSILGLVVPSSGEVSVEGIDVHDDPRRAYRHVGAMLEGARNVYWRLTVRENLAFFARLGGVDPADRREQFETLLDQLDIAGKADVAVKNLSRGQKQKVSLASVLAQDADVVFLDEPTLGLDVESSLELRRELARLVEEEEMTVVLSSHDMDVIEDLCDRVVILNEGEVIADDSVGDLIDLFRTQAYELTVDGGVDEGVRERIDRAYEVTDWEATPERTRFEVSLAEGNDIHELTGVLVEGGCDILAVNTVEPDFEEVFLSLTDRAGSTPAPTAGPASMEDGADE